MWLQVVNSGKFCKENTDKDTVVRIRENIKNRKPLNDDILNYG
jgi:hypothetical protein